jgi:Ca2+-binding RTX toxin-like protein
MLDGRRGRDALRGGSGRNLYRARDGRADTLVGGPGRDSAQIDNGLDRTSGIERRLP